VRIEDLDPPRERPGAAAAQLATLARLGLHADGEIVFQSRRHALYRRALDTLLDAGRAFPCRCSRTDLGASDGIHRTCVAVPDDALRTRSFRLRVPDAVVGFDDPVHGRFEQDLRRDVGDVVLRRADGLWAYQLAVVVDDADQGITHVVRGADLTDNTPRQILLQRALGLPTPAYRHTPLVLGANGEKLSKQNGALALDLSDPVAALNHAAAALDLPPVAGGVGQALAGWTRAWASTIGPPLPAAPP
jgi:glutamyl-Q tRNA(Asp) synthetase